MHTFTSRALSTSLKYDQPDEAQFKQRYESILQEADDLEDLYHSLPGSTPQKSSVEHHEDQSLDSSSTEVNRIEALLQPTPKPSMDPSPVRQSLHFGKSIHFDDTFEAGLKEKLDYGEISEIVNDVMNEDSQSTTTTMPSKSDSMKSNSMNLLMEISSQENSRNLSQFDQSSQSVSPGIIIQNQSGSTSQRNLTSSTGYQSEMETTSQEMDAQFVIPNPFESFSHYSEGEFPENRSYDDPFKTQDDDPFETEGRSTETSYDNPFEAEDPSSKAINQNPFDSQDSSPTISGVSFESEMPPIKTSFTDPSMSNDTNNCESENPFTESSDKASGDVVYEDEEGECVTNLAYVKPFQISSSSFGTSEMEADPGDDFASGFEIYQMLDNDEKEFLEDPENAFIQEANMVDDGKSPDNNSWTYKSHVTMSNPPSWIMDSKPEGMPHFMRISIGALLGAGSAPLGSLEGNSDERPMFGSGEVLSPTGHRAPVLLPGHKESIEEEKDDEKTPKQTPRSSTDDSSGRTPDKACTPALIKNPQISRLQDKMDESVNLTPVSCKDLTLGTISKLVNETSVTDEPADLVAKIMAHSQSKAEKFNRYQQRHGGGKVEEDNQVSTQPTKPHQPGDQNTSSPQDEQYSTNQNRSHDGNKSTCSNETYNHDNSNDTSHMKLSDKSDLSNRNSDSTLLGRSIENAKQSLKNPRLQPSKIPKLKRYSSNSNHSISLNVTEKSDACDLSSEKSINLSSDIPVINGSQENRLSDLSTAAERRTISDENKENIVQAVKSNVQKNRTPVDQEQIKRIKNKRISSTPMRLPASNNEQGISPALDSLSAITPLSENIENSQTFITPEIDTPEIQDNGQKINTRNQEIQVEQVGEYLEKSKPIASPLTAISKTTARRDHPIKSFKADGSDTSSSASTVPTLLTSGSLCRTHFANKHTQLENRLPDREVTETVRSSTDIIGNVEKTPLTEHNLNRDECITTTTGQTQTTQVYSGSSLDSDLNRNNSHSVLRPHQFIQNSAQTTPSLKFSGQSGGTVDNYIQTSPYMSHNQTSRLQGGNVQPDPPAQMSRLKDAQAQVNDSLFMPGEIDAHYSSKFYGLAERSQLSLEKTLLRSGSQSSDHSPMSLEQDRLLSQRGCSYPDVSGVSPPLSKRYSLRLGTDLPPRQSSANSYGSHLIEAPPTLAIPTCCLGLTSETLLPLTNRSNRWMKCDLIVTELHIDGVKVSTFNQQPFRFRETGVIEPHTTEQVRIIFDPPSAGVYVASLNISTNRESGQRIDTIVSLQGVAEAAKIKIPDVLDYQALPWGCKRTMRLLINNLGRTTLRLRLQIMNDGTKSLGSFNFVSGHPSSDLSNVTKFISLPPTGEEQCELAVQLEVPVQPVERSSQQQLTARLLVFMDNMTSVSSPLASTLLKANLGIARLHIPGNCIEVEKFAARLGQMCEHSIPLRNAGNIPMTILLELANRSEFFEVVPKQLDIKPGQECLVSVRFRPRGRQGEDVKSLLLLHLQHSDTTWEISLDGHVTSSEEVPRPRKPNGHLLLTDKFSLAWGGVAVGEKKQLRLRVQSDAVQPMKLNFLIRDSDAFKYEYTLDGQTMSCSKREIVIQPSETYPVYVSYNPKEIFPSQGSLVIKPANTNIKYVIPLTGYGGTSDVKLEQVQQGSLHYGVDLDVLRPLQNCRFTFKVSNEGTRAAFIYFVPCTDVDLQRPMPESQISIRPQRVCLPAGRSQMIDVDMLPSERELALCRDSPAIVACIAVLYGDEVVRQKFRGLISDGKSSCQADHKSNKYRLVNFNCSFQNENAVFEGHIHQADADNGMFHRQLRRLELVLFGRPPPAHTPASPPVRDHSNNLAPNASILAHQGHLTGMNDTQFPWEETFVGQISSKSRYSPLEKAKLGRVRAISLNETEFPAGDTTMKQLPSRSRLALDIKRACNGMQVQNTDESRVRIRSQDLDATASPTSSVSNMTNSASWDVMPKLVLISSVATSPMSRFEIINNNDCEIQFDLSYPAYYITVTPEHGTVKPHSYAICCISAKSNLDRKGVHLPWHGAISVYCEGESTNVHVQVEPGHQQISKKLVSLSANSTHGRGGAGEILLKFPDTELDRRSEIPLEVKNTSEKNIKWIMATLVEPYLKPEDRSELYRVDHTVFWLDDKAGVLAPGESSTIKVRFNPRKCGLYSSVYQISVTTIDALSHQEEVQKVELTGKCIPGGSRSSSQISTISRSGVSITPLEFDFGSIEPGEKASLNVRFTNRENKAQTLSLSNPGRPFSFKLKEAVITLKPLRYVTLAMHFYPRAPGHFTSFIEVSLGNGRKQTLKLSGSAECGLSTKNRDTI